MRDILGLALLVTQAVLLAPLIFRLAWSKSGAGISLAGEMIWAVAGIGWAIHGFMADSWAVLFSGILASLGSGILSLLLWKYKNSQERRTAVLLSVVTLLGLGTLSVLMGENGLSIGLAIFGIVQFIPQTVESARYIIGRVPALGVSPLGAGLRAVYTGGWAMWAAAWMLWGITFQDIDWPLAAWGAAGVVAFTLQAITALRRPPVKGVPQDDVVAV